jgi:uncharacterized membrane protein
MRRALAAAVALTGLAYPFAVYFGLGRVSPRWLTLPLAAIWLARALTALRTSPRAVLVPAAACLFCIVLACLNSVAMLRWYPVAINLAGLSLFGLSLRFGPPVIERLARLTDPDLSPSGQRYTRHVTQVWTGFFAANATVSALLAQWAPWRWWTLYNGAISYGLIGLLLAGEWLLRPRHAKAA